jgi:hypothetical protein
MIEITGLTPEQIEMLDFMWNELDTEEDYFNWYDSLDEGQQRQAELLQRMVIMESIDEDMLAQASFPQAMKVIDSIRK